MLKPIPFNEREKQIAKQAREDAIDLLKTNCIEHIRNSNPLTIEEIINIIIFESEQLKEQNNENI